jgi:hypothetical protein
MTHLSRILVAAIAHLEKEHRASALIGGLAVSARSEPRFTRDVDLAVVVADDREAEATLRALVAQGYRLVASVEHDLLGRLSTARLLPPGSPPEGAIVDLLFASSGIEDEIVRAAESTEIMKGVRVPLARIGHLLALKVLARDDARRPQDIADIRALLTVADGREIDRAREALALVSQRGFARGRDLEAELDALLGRGPG